MSARKAQIKRKTRETKIDLVLDLDGSGKTDFKTGLPFLEHMLDCLCRQALFDLKIRAEGDLKVDDHHLVEDLGIALGDALAQALGDKAGIRRYGSASAPLDEARVEAVLDLSGRPYLAYGLLLANKKVKDFDLQLMEEFTRAFSDRARMTLHLTQGAGKNNHHILEAAFKALGLALRLAVEKDPRRKGTVASTKGTLIL
ncbi:MAG: imidazoleglycerol-phosphate dehydratase HisB [candidate division FCPU426 bacterium]